MPTMGYEDKTVDAAFAATVAGADPDLAVTTALIDIEIPAEAKRAATEPKHATTVLPRVAFDAGQVRLEYQGRARYQTDKVIGEGGMGTVALAHDHDIDRKVALKQIRPEVAGGAGLARFVEEVRTIGRLEHPNIVPIHDVGVNEKGEYFFVMKYVEGETLEDIITKLASGDPKAHQEYTFEARVQIMLGLLRALAYSHDQGILHRDLKPANVMVGPYGEVVLMDWGIARPIEGHDVAASLPTVDESNTPSESSGKTTRRRLIQTAVAQLVGTPAYMSPEQAEGKADLDVRSDLYSATVVFHELMTLRHYLDDCRTLPAMLTGVINTALPHPGSSAYAHSTQGVVPAEYIHFLRRGMEKSRDARFGSAFEMIQELEDALEGKVRVQCHATMTKRMAREAGRFVDRHPHVGFAAMTFGSLTFVAGVGALIASAVAMM